MLDSIDSINHAPLSCPVAEANPSRGQSNLSSDWLRVWLVDGQDLCEKCRFPRTSTQRSPAAHSPAGWSVRSVTSAQCAHGASTVQGNRIYPPKLKNHCVLVFYVKCQYFTMLNGKEALRFQFLTNDGVNNRVSSFSQLLCTSHSLHSANQHYGSRYSNFWHRSIHTGTKRPPSSEDLQLHSNLFSVISFPFIFDCFLVCSLWGRGHARNHEEITDLNDLQVPLYTRRHWWAWG